MSVFRLSRWTVPWSVGTTDSRSHYGLPDTMPGSVGRKGPTLAVVWYICYAAFVRRFPEVLCQTVVAGVPGFLLRWYGLLFVAVGVVAVPFLGGLFEDRVRGLCRPLPEVNSKDHCYNSHDPHDEDWYIVTRSLVACPRINRHIT